MKTKEKYKIDASEIRTYQFENSCVFKKNNEQYGGLSNMATQFPLRIKQTDIRTTEALYQACRFPHLPEVQRKIINQTSPMRVKMISNSYKSQSRGDWDAVRIKIMKWCIHVKLAQNFISFGTVLDETGLKPIVENSSSDNFWGAIPAEDGKILCGKNALGRLLMDLRKNFHSENKYSILYVEKPEVEDFLLFNNVIEAIDERQNFVESLHEYWKRRHQSGLQGQLFKEF
ncbi:MAG TPA: NADAR family protein [Flavobacterium sp.]|jgi:ribA/ribD-fused uncharacterized protein